jgi:fructokinase
VLGEARWGAARDGRGGYLRDFIYLTIGTGIGGGAMVGGEVLHGLLHPEMGHLRIPHDLVQDPFRGNCPFHGDCLEGLASGPAIESRWKQTAADLPPSHPAWRLEAHYLALGIVNLTLTLSPRRILLGGGVMRQPTLFTQIRQEFTLLLQQYIRHGELEDHLESYIQSPGLDGRAGVLGGLILAEKQLRE